MKIICIKKGAWREIQGRPIDRCPVFGEEVIVFIKAGVWYWLEGYDGRHYANRFVTPEKFEETYKSSIKEKV